MATISSTRPSPGGAAVKQPPMPETDLVTTRTLGARQTVRSRASSVESPSIGHATADSPGHAPNNGTLTNGKGAHNGNSAAADAHRHNSSPPLMPAASASQPLPNARRSFATTGGSGGGRGDEEPPRPPPYVVPMAQQLQQLQQQQQQQRRHVGSNTPTPLSVYTPPPSAGRPVALELATQHAASAPRGAPSPSPSSSSSTARAPKPKAAFYNGISSTSATPPLQQSPGNSAGASRTVTPPPSQPQQTRAHALVPAAGHGPGVASNGSKDNHNSAALPPLVPQGTRSNIPRSLDGGGNTTTTNGNSNGNGTTNNRGQQQQQETRQPPARRQPPPQSSFGFRLTLAGEPVQPGSWRSTPSPVTAAATTPPKAVAVPAPTPTPTTTATGRRSSAAAVMAPNGTRRTSPGNLSLARSSPAPTDGSKGGAPEQRRLSTGLAQIGSSNNATAAPPLSATEDVPVAPLPFPGRERVPLRRQTTPAVSARPAVPTAAPVVAVSLLPSVYDLPSVTATTAPSLSGRESPGFPADDVSSLCTPNSRSQALFDPVTSLAEFAAQDDRAEHPARIGSAGGAASTNRSNDNSTNSTRTRSRTQPGRTEAVVQKPQPQPQPQPQQQQQQRPAAVALTPPRSAYGASAGIPSPSLLTPQGTSKSGESTKPPTHPPTANTAKTKTVNAKADADAAPFQRRPRHGSLLVDQRDSMRPPLSTGPRGFNNSNGNGGGTADSRAREAAALRSYLREEQLDLSMSTFTALGSTLSASLALRVLNLRGSTMPSEGLRGLADVATLESICVSHMRNLTSLQPLVSPANPQHRCRLVEIDAQCTPLTTDGLRGLDRLPLLRKLDLSMTKVDCVHLLAAATGLRELYLAATQVTSDGLLGLESLPALHTLNVSRTKVTSLRRLAESRSLETLLLYSCKTSDADLRGVPQMPRLAIIDLSTTKVTDLSALRESRSLTTIKAQWLSLKNCVDIVRDRKAAQSAGGGGGGRLASEASASLWRDSEAGYAGLADIPTLETVDLSFNTLRSVRSLSNSTSLKHLVLRRTKVDSAGIAQIHRLANTLETLEITNLTDNIDGSEEEGGSSSGSLGTSVSRANGMLSNVNVLASLLRVTRLDLSFTDVYDLRLLRELPRLRELIIVETLVTVDGLRGIEDIPTLELLDLSQTSVMSLQFLMHGATNLRKILVRSNRNVRGFRLGAVAQLKSLEILDMGDTIVEDAKAMWTADWALQELSWRWRERREAAGPVAALACWVTSDRLMGIATMPCLTRLDLTNGAIHNLDFLAGATALTALILDGCRLLRDHHVAAVSGERFAVAALEELDLSNNPHFTDLTCLAWCTRLRVLAVVNDTGLGPRSLEGVWNLPTVRELQITNSGAEEALIASQQQQSGGGGGGGGGGSSVGVGFNFSGGRVSRQGRDDGNVTMRDVSAVLDASATPAQFRVPRRRRVSIVVTDVESGNTARA